MFPLDRCLRGRVHSLVKQGEIENSGRKFRIQLKSAAKLFRRFIKPGRIAFHISDTQIAMNVRTGPDFPAPEPDVSFEHGLSPSRVSGETIRLALKRLGIGWKRAKKWIGSPDPEYARKKAPATA